MRDKNELKRQYLISLVTFLSTGVVASFSTGYIYFTTRSLLFLLQFLLALSGFVIHAIFLWTARTLYTKDCREFAHYNGKLESFATLIGLFAVYVNLIVLCAISLYRIFFPSEIASLTTFSKITTIVCMAYNIFLVFRCYTSVKNTGNLVMRAQLIEAGKNLFSWILCALTYIVATCFPEWMLAPFVEPFFCILIALTVGYFYFGLLKKCSLDLLDKTGDAKLESDVKKMLVADESVKAVSFRTCGKRVVVDITLDLSPDTDWHSAKIKAASLSEQICSLYPECHIHSKIDFE
jgi:divalent metal cation (Fe/Co/Zn/Cd) transporter